MLETWDRAGRVEDVDVDVDALGRSKFRHSVLCRGLTMLFFPGGCSWQTSVSSCLEVSH